jgi:ectoine hydroxylase-related dioxygenase (phytanoyl-CoA dioxygenase family)
LDHCTSENGALKVIEKSHKHGVIAIEEWKQDKPGTERICEVPLGGIQLMKPLTLHSSYRTENNQHRRVIHLEFTDQELPEGLEWNEAIRFES